MNSRCVVGRKEELFLREAIAILLPGWDAENWTQHNEAPFVATRGQHRLHHGHRGHKLRENVPDRRRGDGNLPGRSSTGTKTNSITQMTINEVYQRVLSTSSITVLSSSPAPACAGASSSQAPGGHDPRRRARGHHGHELEGGRSGVFARGMSPSERYRAVLSDGRTRRGDESEELKPGTVSFAFSVPRSRTPLLAPSLARSFACSGEFRRIGCPNSRGYMSRSPYCWWGAKVTCVPRMSPCTRQSCRLSRHIPRSRRAWSAPRRNCSLLERCVAVCFLRPPFLLACLLACLLATALD